MGCGNETKLTMHPFTKETFHQLKKCMLGSITSFTATTYVNQFVSKSSNCIQ